MPAWLSQRADQRSIKARIGRLYAYAMTDVKGRFGVRVDHRDMRIYAVAPIYR